MLTGIHLLLRWIALTLLAFVVFLGIELRHFYFDELNLASLPRQFEVKPGTSIRQIGQQLESMNILSHSHFFISMARLSDRVNKLQAGEYLLTPGMTTSDLLTKLTHGDVILRHLTIVEGWTVKQILNELHESAYLKHDLKNVDQAGIITQLSLPVQHLEGWLFPDTYSFAKFTAESEIVLNGYRMMQQQLSRAWEGRDRTVDYTDPYQALIVASLVEKESAVDQERPMIAGVILRRIKNRMLLQIDPTVIYALQDRYLGKLYKQDLKFESPYNTYIHHGLPPTPIASPGRASLQAAMHPDQGDALYFVADGKGGHVFSATLEQHNKAVLRYRQLQQNEQPAATPSSDPLMIQKATEKIVESPIE